MSPNPAFLRILDYRKERAGNVSREGLLGHWRLRHCVGSRNHDRGDLSGGSAVVFGSVPFDCLRDQLLQAVLRREGGAFMQIVIWKSPKALRGILRRFFKIKE